MKRDLSEALGLPEFPVWETLNIFCVSKHRTNKIKMTTGSSMWHVTMMPATLGPVGLAWMAEQGLFAFIFLIV